MTKIFQDYYITLELSQTHGTTRNFFFLTSVHASPRRSERDHILKIQTLFAMLPSVLELPRGLASVLLGSQQGDRS